MKRRDQSQTEQLRKALAEREARLQEAQARLAALEGSTSLQVGRALTGAAKKPGRGLVRLPRELYRLWRGSSGAGGHATGGRVRGATEPVRSYDAERQEARLLAGQATARDDRIVIAGILSAEARAALEHCARIIPLRPHDVQVVFDSVDVDLVLVSASAARPGNLWAHVGSPAAVDRTRALRWVLESAAARGVPSILVKDVPAPPALAGLGFEHVHDGDLGVPLHRFNPIAAEPERGAVPVHVSGAAAAPALPPALAGQGPDRIVRAEPAWDGLPDTLRAAASAVVDTAALADRAAACGARALLVGARPEPDLPQSVARTGAGAEDLARVAAAGPLTPGELRLALRSIFLARATPVRLAELLERVSLAPGSGSPALPLAGRAVAVLARPLDDTESLALADDVFRQRHPPAEIVVPASRVRFAGVERLRARGFAVRAVPDPERGASPYGEWARLAAAATTPWTALWESPGGESLLADALCAAECSGADAVGPAVTAGGGTGGRSGADDLGWAAAGQEYVFVSEVRPVLARRDLVRKGLHPGVWSRHGARLLALGDLRPTGHDTAPDHAHAG
ncbi:hypothetical protein [Actinorugispora endophytica]|uniref:Uncharacterized protein n=1 Tax=Actinorugispora endophytica TaxID=1605990 RepID=A0A4R6V0Q6_9ACTN|nr:hypothetical protein [Actinorugispora endophytica]TDQ51923.1 hypothetical protein EV190_10933 [Actinorugispora endophytica]